MPDAGRILVIAGLLTVVLAVSVWNFVGWQNDTRQIFGMEPISPAVWPQIVIVGLLVAWLLLAVGRGFRTLFRKSADFVDRWLPRRLAVTLSSILTLLIIWGLLSGAILDVFFAGANAIFSTRDSGDKPFATETTSEYRSGGPRFSREVG